MYTYFMSTLKQGYPLKPMLYHKALALNSSAAMLQVLGLAVNTGESRSVGADTIVVSTAYTPLQ